MKLIILVKNNTNSKPGANILAKKPKNTKDNVYFNHFFLLCLK